MFQGKKIIAVIPARGGSKGFPRKNIQELSGKPLVAWSIGSAQASKLLDHFVVTTDDVTISKVSEEWGAQVICRPSELATDTANIESALFHALEKMEGNWDLIVLLQPTSPLRLGQDIDDCIRTMFEKNAPAAISVCEPQKSPYWMYKVSEEARMSPVAAEIDAVRRQDLPKVYSLNGAVYVAEIEWLKSNGRFMSADTAAHIMPIFRSVDIDSELDLVIAESIFNNFNTNF